MRKRKQLVMLAFAAVVAAVMTACTVEDNANPNPVTSNDPLQVVPVSAAEFQAKVLGGWSETERREINADGTLGEVFDWTDWIGTGSEDFEIRQDAIYYFMPADALPWDGYYDAVYTYNPQDNFIMVDGFSNMQILSITADELVVKKNGYRIVYTRMSNELLEWFWQNFGVNLRDKRGH